MEQSHLERLAKDIRSTYVFERRHFVLRTKGVCDDFGKHPVARWDGGTDSYGKKHQAIWPKLAAFFLKKNVDFVYAVKALFETTKGGPPPTPDKLTQDWVLSAAARWKKKKVEELTHVWKFDRESAAGWIQTLANENPGFETRKIWRDAIILPEANISAIGRYCLAKTIGEEKIASFYFDEAFSSYARMPDVYEKVMGTAIPVEMKQRYQDLVRQAATENERCQRISSPSRFRR